MPTDDPSTAGAPAHQPAVRAPRPTPYEAVHENAWLEDEEELPPRPRRRLLTPVPVALMATLLIACGFIGGVLVEKGQGGSSSSTASAAGLASRFAALRGAATGSSGSGGSATGAVPGAGGGGFAGGGSGAGGVVSGQVAYIVGDTLYVTTAEADTVKVSTSAGSTVTKTDKSSVSAIHPGETIVATGTTGRGGAIAAESIRIGAGSAGGLGSLFGGRRTGGGGSTEQSLFGQG